MIIYRLEVIRGSGYSAYIQRTIPYIGEVEIFILLLTL